MPVFLGTQLKFSFAILILGAFLGLFVLSGCEPAGENRDGTLATSEDANAEFEIIGALEDLDQNRSRFADALIRSTEEVPAISDSTWLATRLDISRSRAAGIDDEDIDLRAIATSIRNDFVCAPGGCICAGDDDCNSMFSGVCRAPASGGKCWDFGGGAVVCVCKPVGNAFAVR